MFLFLIIQDTADESVFFKNVKHRHQHLSFSLLILSLDINCEFRVMSSAFVVLDNSGEMRASQIFRTEGKTNWHES